MLQILFERVRQRLRGGFAFCPRAVLQQIERRLDGERFSQNLEAQIGDGRIELPVPGRIGGHRLFVKQLLDAIFELIGLVAAHVLEPRPVMAERRIGHGGLQQRIVDAVEFEREEQKMRGRRRQPLLHVAIKFRARRIDRVAGMHEAGVGREPPHAIVERLIAPHGLRQRRAGRRRARHVGQLALKGLLESRAFGIGATEIALDRRIVEAGIEVGEIPFGQRAETGRAALGRTLGGDSVRGFLGAGHLVEGPTHPHLCQHYDARKAAKPRRQT